MNKHIWLIIYLCLNIIANGQVDTTKIIDDIKTKTNKINTLATNVKLTEKLFYSSDTNIYSGSFLVDYSFSNRSTFFLLSIYEKTYNRYLVYDTSGIEYNISSEGIVSVIKNIAKTKTIEGGLQEPLFPVIFDKLQKFQDWFYLDYSRIKIDQINDTLVTLTYIGNDTTNMASPPKLKLEINRNNGYPKKIITEFILANDEVQYQQYEFNYTVSDAELQKHKDTFAKILDYQVAKSDKKQKTKEFPLFVKEGDSLPILNVMNLNGENLNIVAQDKYVLLDFTYLSCKPCMEAIPMLNKLSKDYGDIIDIYSINPFDKSSQIISHKQKMNVLYTQFTITPMEFKKLYIKNFPLFILTNKSRIVQIIRIGYGENLYNEITTVIKKE